MKILQILKTSLSILEYLILVLFTILYTAFEFFKGENIISRMLYFLFLFAALAVLKFYKFQSKNSEEIRRHFFLNI